MATLKNSPGAARLRPGTTAAPPKHGPRNARNGKRINGDGPHGVTPDFLDLPGSRFAAVDLRTLHQMSERRVPKNYMPSSSRTVAGISFNPENTRTRFVSREGRDERNVRLISRKKPFPFKAARPRKSFLMKKVADGSLYLAWPREGGYWIRPRQNRIEYRLFKGTPEAFLWDSVEGPLTAFMMALEGCPLFHGSAVKIGGKAVLFLGHSGSGKSTLAAELTLRGFPLVSDDLLRFSEAAGQIKVWPGARHIRLWPESAKALLKDAEKLPGVVPQAEKKRLAESRLPGGMAKGPVPVGEIFAFERSKACRSPRLQDLTLRKKWETLAEFLHLIKYDETPFLSAAFEEINTLARRTTVRRLVIPDNLKSLKKTADFVLASVLRPDSAASGRVQSAAHRR